jgi:hypothetical protein
MLCRALLFDAVFVRPREQRHESRQFRVARLEARVSFELFLDRLPGLRLVPDQEYRWVPNMTIPEFKTRKVEWT